MRAVEPVSPNLPYPNVLQNRRHNPTCPVGRDNGHTKRHDFWFPLGITDKNAPTTDTYTNSRTVRFRMKVTISRRRFVRKLVKRPIQGEFEIHLVTAWALIAGCTLWRSLAFPIADCVRLGTHQNKSFKIRPIRIARLNMTRKEALDIFLKRAPPPRRPRFFLECLMSRGMSSFVFLLGVRASRSAIAQKQASTRKHRSQASERKRFKP